MKLPKCESNDYQVEEVYIYNYNDLKFVNGEIVGLKRKYGEKFKREVYKFDTKAMPACKGLSE